MAALISSDLAMGSYRPFPLPLEFQCGVAADRSFSGWKMPKLGKAMGDEEMATSQPEPAAGAPVDPPPALPVNS